MESSNSIDRDDAAIAGGTGVAAVVVILGATSTSNTGPILAFAGALLVALIAAYTAHRRQTSALAAESGRQAQQLTAEAERLERQLAHDRELADVADLRAVMERCLDSIDKLHAAYVAVLIEVRDHGNQVFEAGQEGTSRDTTLNTNTEFVAFSNAMNAIRVRLPGDDPAVESFRDLREVMAKCGSAAYAGDTKEFEAVVPEFGMAYGEFADRAQMMVGSAVSLPTAD